MSEWLRKKKLPLEIDNALEREVTQGRVTFIKGINFDLTTKTLEIYFGTSVEDYLPERTLIFEKVEEFSEEMHEPEEEGFLESLIGLDQHRDEQGSRYVLVTDVREVYFSSKAEPRIEIKGRK